MQSAKDRRRILARIQEVQKDLGNNFMANRKFGWILQLN